MNILILFLIFGTVRVIAVPSLHSVHPVLCRSNSCRECLKNPCTWMITSHDEAKCSPIMQTSDDDGEVLLAAISYRAAHMCPDGEFSISNPDGKVELKSFFSSPSIYLLVPWLILMVTAIVLCRKQRKTERDLKTLAALKGLTRLTTTV